MSKGMIHDNFKAYLDHELVERLSEEELNALNSKPLNDTLNAADQMIRGVREYCLSADKEMREYTGGQFSSAIVIARGLSFLEAAHYKKNVQDISNDVWKITPTTSLRDSFNRNIQKKVIPNLENAGLIEFDENKRMVTNFMPYPVGSKLYAKRYFLDNSYFYQQQANHFDIVKKVQSFPVETFELQNEAPSPDKFMRDLNALNVIDVVRDQRIKNQEYIFSKSFLTDGAQSVETWEQVLDSTDNVRMGLKSLMDLQAEYGGFISHAEIMESTGWGGRQVSQLMRNINSIGISRMTTTIEKDDALTRSISGTLLNMNYHELDNAQAILTLARSIPHTVDILYKLQKYSELNEEDLAAEFGYSTVHKVRNSLNEIKLISDEGFYEGIWKLIPFRGYEQFLWDVLTVCAGSRHMLPPEYAKQLEPDYKKFDIEKFEKTAKQISFDYFEEIGKELHR